MKPARYILPVLLGVLFWSCEDEISADLKVGNLKCEYLTAAVLAKPDPGFSWELASQVNGQLQSAWQVIVSDDTVKIGEGKGNIFVRIVATKLQQYTTRIYDYEGQGDTLKRFAFALAELQVLNKNEVISENCPVSYKDALIKVDREDGYDPDMHLRQKHRPLPCRACPSGKYIVTSEL